MLSATQARAIVRSTGRLNFLEGSVRGGKTYAGSVWFLERCVAGPPGMFAVVGKTHRTVWTNVLRPMQDIAGRAAVRVRRGSGEATICGRDVIIYGANNVGAVDVIAGSTLAGALGDEVTRWPEDVYRMLLSRLSVPKASALFTLNPDGPRHWLLTDYLDNPAVAAKTVHHFRMGDNPTLTDDYQRALRAEYGPPSSVWYQRLIEGRWVAAEGAIWPYFDGHHRLPAPDRADYHVLAVDYGTVNPLSALLLAVDDHDQRIHVADEWRWDSHREHQQLTDAEYSKRIREWLAGLGVVPQTVVVDPSASSFITQLWADGVAGVTKADNTVDDGLRNVSALLAGRNPAGVPHLTFDPSPRLDAATGEIAGYVWDPKALLRGVEQPLKEADHAPDALRYGIRYLRRQWRHWMRAAAA